MPFIESDGIRFHYALSGAARGPLVAFQHGLGGDVSQPHGILGDSVHLRVLSFDCRSHGRTGPLGPLEQLTFSSFADDLRAVLDALGVDGLIVGGLSMGAGVALKFVGTAILPSKTVRALIRPALGISDRTPRLRKFLRFRERR